MALFEVADELAATRDRGREYRQKLEALLEETPSDELVTVTFRNVTAMTGSFTDEFLGKLLVARAAGITGRAPLVVTDLNEETAEEVEMCLERRRTMAVWLDDGSATLLGGDAVLRDTFKAGLARGDFRASDIADDLGTTVQNVNNRLKRLVEAGALVRVRRDPAAGGKEFVYRITGLSKANVSDPIPSG